MIEIMVVLVEKPDAHLPQASTSFLWHSVSCQLIGRKSNLIFYQLNYLIEGTVALIQQVDDIEQCSDIISAKQTDDVIIIVTNILREINYQKPHHSSDPHRL